MMSLFKPLITLLFILYLGACSSEPEQALNIPSEIGKPALWMVEGKDDKGDGKGGGTAYLFGTIHLLPAGVKWHGADIAAAEKASDQLILEVTGLEDSQAVAKIFTSMGTRNGLPPLSQRIPPELRDKLYSAADPVPGPLFILDNMESWAAALTIASSISGDLGLKTEAGVEHILGGRFRSAKKPVTGLETIEQQFGYFDNLTESEQRKMLSSIIESADGNISSFQKLLDNWLAGNVDALIENSDSGMLSIPKIRQILLDGRNRTWSSQIMARIDAGQHPFVAVGSAHLAGPQGIPALLTENGYRVKRIQ